MTKAKKNHRVLEIRCISGRDGTDLLGHVPISQCSLRNARFSIQSRQEGSIAARKQTSIWVRSVPNSEVLAQRFLAPLAALRGIILLRTLPSSVCFGENCDASET
jgi:hypothetical protein